MVLNWILLSVITVPLVSGAIETSSPPGGRAFEMTWGFLLNLELCPYRVKKRDSDL